MQSVTQIRDRRALRPDAGVARIPGEVADVELEGLELVEVLVRRRDVNGLRRGIGGFATVSGLGFATLSGFAGTAVVSCAPATAVNATSTAKLARICLTPSLQIL